MQPPGLTMHELRNSERDPENKTGTESGQLDYGIQQDN